MKCEIQNWWNHLHNTYSWMSLFRRSFECWQAWERLQPEWCLPPCQYTTHRVARIRPSIKAGFNLSQQSLLLLNCLYKYHLVCYGCFHINILLITNYISKLQISPTTSSSENCTGANILLHVLCRAKTIKHNAALNICHQTIQL